MKTRQIRLSPEKAKLQGFFPKPSTKHGHAKYPVLISGCNVLVYDIETSRNVAEVWNTGKTYIGHAALRGETKIITVAWKWLGSDVVEYLKWDRKKNSHEGGCDKRLVEAFAKIYNRADAVLGWNNNNFDNKIVKARCMKFDFDINIYQKSIDVMKLCKAEFRVPSAAMAYYARYLGMEGKLQHTGLPMWQDIQWGKKRDSKQAMKLMVKYNLQDVTLTEEIYLRVRKYLKPVFHVGMLTKGDKLSCPTCGSVELRRKKQTTTAAGTIQHVMKCKSCKSQSKMNNSNYLKSL